jgi:hypothetical protein
VVLVTVNTIFVRCTCMGQQRVSHYCTSLQSSAILSASFPSLCHGIYGRRSVAMATTCSTDIGGRRALALRSCESLTTKPTAAAAAWQQQRQHCLQLTTPNQTRISASRSTRPVNWQRSAWCSYRWRSHWHNWRSAKHWAVANRTSGPPPPQG